MALEDTDREIYNLIKKEKKRQQNTLDLIASENIAPEEVLEANGSVLTNKYAEGYPGARYYGGCGVVDEIEVLAIERAKDLFQAESANVQPHSGSQANAAVYLSSIKPEDKILSLSLDAGGHLTHGMALNFSGQIYRPVFYKTGDDDLIDYDYVRDLAKKEKPKMIIAGGSAYPREIKFSRFREIADDIGALLLADIAHISGFVSSGLHEKPDADFMTTTTHKTLGGPRGGLILMKKEWEAKVNRAVFPGQQGGPQMQSIASKAVAFKLANTDDFKDKMKRTQDLARTIAGGLLEEGIDVVTGGTDNHLVLLDLSDEDITGGEAQIMLEDIGIVVNKNAIKNDTRPPQDPSGLRIGTVALASRGINQEEAKEIAKAISKTVKQESYDRSKIKDIIKNHPIY